MSDRSDDARDRRTPLTGSLSAMLLVAGAILTLVVVAVLLLTQIPKWTCRAPDGSWLEASGRCIELP